MEKKIVILAKHPNIYTPAKRMFLGVYWNQPICPSVCPSVYKIQLSVKVLEEYQVTFSYSSTFDRFNLKTRLF